MANVELRPAVMVTPAMTEALHRLDVVQAEIRANQPEPVVAEPVMIWRVPSAAELVQWKQQAGIRYMGQPHPNMQVPTDERVTSFGWTTHTGEGVPAPSRNESITKAGVEPIRHAMEEKSIQPRADVPTRSIGGTTTAKIGRTW